MARYIAPSFLAIFYQGEVYSLSNVSGLHFHILLSPLPFIRNTNLTYLIFHLDFSNIVLQQFDKNLTFINRYINIYRAIISSLTFNTTLLKKSNSCISLNQRKEKKNKQITRQPTMFYDPFKAEQRSKKGEKVKSAPSSKFCSLCCTSQYTSVNSVHREKKKKEIEREDARVKSRSPSRAFLRIPRSDFRRRKYRGADLLDVAFRLAEIKREYLANVSYKSKRRNMFRVRSEAM